MVSFAKLIAVSQSTVYAVACNIVAGTRFMGLAEFWRGSADSKSELKAAKQKNAFWQSGRCAIWPRDSIGAEIID